MTNFDHLQKELEKIGLSPVQAKIYLMLVKNREMRIQEIVKSAEIPRSSVYENLKKLFELGIAEEVIENNFKLIRPYSLGIITHGLDEEVLRLQKVKSDLKTLEKSLEVANIDSLSDSTTVRYYKNRSGARQLFWNSLKAKDRVYVYSDWSRRRYVGKKFYEQFVSESRNREIKENVLINANAETLKYIKINSYPGSPNSRTKIEDIKVIDSEKMLIKGDTLLYDNICAHVYLKNVVINGFEIECSDYVEMQRHMFKILWSQAHPVRQYL